jgi:putative DNA primase/helicase
MGLNKRSENQRKKTETVMSTAIEEVVYCFDELEGLELQPLQYLIDPPIRERSITQMFAVRETYKTLMAQAMAVSVATGCSCIEGWKVFRKHKVLYVDGELPVQDIRDRIRTFSKDDLTNLFIYPNDYISEGSVATLTSEDWRSRFLNYVNENKFELVIFDNLSSLAPGLDEMLKIQWSPINDYFQKLKRHGITIVFIHHAGKTRGMFSRGHSGLEDNIDTSILLEKPQGIPSGEPDVIISFPKYRARIEMTKRSPKRYRLIDGIWRDEELGAENRLRTIAEFVDSGIPQSNIGEMLKITQQAVSKHVKDLRNKRMLDDNNNLTEEGIKWLEK